MSNNFTISLKDLKEKEVEQLQYLLNKYQRHDKLDLLILKVRGEF